MGIQFISTIIYIIGTNYNSRSFLSGCFQYCVSYNHFFQPSRNNNPKRNGVRLKPVRAAPKSRKVRRAHSNPPYTCSLALQGDSLAEEDGGDDEDEEEDGNEDGAGSEEEQNGDGENDDA